MSIFLRRPKLEQIEEGISNLANNTGIRITELGDDYIRGTMPVDEKTMQPYGILHGGASCLLGETLGSIAANLTLDTSVEVAVGQNLNASHLKSVPKGGMVTGTATIVHKGKRSQVWNIDLEDERKRLTCRILFTIAVIERRS